MKSSSVFLFMSIIVFAVFSRWLPHPPNFSPLMGVAMFSGALFLGAKNKWLFIAPIVALFISDIYLGFHSLSLLVYLSFAAICFVGYLQRNSLSQGSLKGAAHWLTGSLFSAVLFFVITNLGVFFITDLYPKTSEGLTLCFMSALPFFRNTVVSSVLYSMVFYTAYSMMKDKALESAYILKPKR